MENEIYIALAKVHNYYPELRVCQILSIAANKAGWSNSDLFYCSDSTILEGLNMLLKQRGGNE